MYLIFIFLFTTRSKTSRRRSVALAGLLRLGLHHSLLLSFYVESVRLHPAMIQSEPKLRQSLSRDGPNTDSNHLYKLANVASIPWEKIRPSTELAQALRLELIRMFTIRRSAILYTFQSK